MKRRPHPTERKTGDQGQRFLVRAFNYPRENEECDIGFCQSEKSAELMASGIFLTPSCERAWIVDRQENRIIKEYTDAESSEDQSGSPPTD